MAKSAKIKLGSIKGIRIIPADKKAIKVVLVGKKYLLIYDEEVVHTFPDGALGKMKSDSFMRKVKKELKEVGKNSREPLHFYFTEKYR